MWPLVLEQMSERTVWVCLYIYILNMEDAREGGGDAQCAHSDPKVSSTHSKIFVIFSNSLLKQ